MNFLPLSNYADLKLEVNILVFKYIKLIYVFNFLKKRTFNLETINDGCFYSNIFWSSSNGNRFIYPRHQKSGAKASITSVQSNTRPSPSGCCASLAFSLTSVLEFFPPLSKANNLFVLQLSFISHAFCSNLFFCNL